MIGNDDVYRKLVERHSVFDTFKILDVDRYVTDRKLSVNHLVWLQIMGLMETWDIL